MHRTLEFARELHRAIARDNAEYMQAELVDLLYDHLKHQPDDELRLRSQRFGYFGAAFLVRKLHERSFNTMDLYDNKLSADSVGQLLKLNVARLNIGGNGLTTLKPLCEFLANQTTMLEVLELGDPSGFAFPAYNANGQARRVLGNRLDSVTLTELFKALEYNRQLKYLGLSGNSLDGVNVQFATLFRQNHVLTALDLSYCELGNRGAASLLRALLGSSSITYLNIRGNGLTMLVAGLLATLLQANVNLSYLNASENAFGAEGARAIARGLAGNRGLRQLELQNCAFGDYGVSLICSVLGRDAYIPAARPSSGEMGFFDDIQGIFERVDADIVQERRITLQDHAGNTIEEVQLRRRTGTPVTYDKANRARSGTKHFRVRYTQFGGASAQSETNLRETGFDYAGTDKPQQSPVARFRRTADRCAADHRSAYGDEVSQSSETSADCSLANNCAVSVTLDTALLETQLEPSRSGLVFLNISRNASGTASFPYVCAMLERPACPLRRLNFSGTRLDFESCVALAGALVGEAFRFEPDEFLVFANSFRGRSYLSITQIALANCCITDRAFLHLCIAFTWLQDLTSVDMSDNFISRAGEPGMLILIGHPALMRFGMHGNQVSHSGYGKLLASMRAKRLKIAHSGPRVLESKIINLRRDTRRLPHDREELQFLKKSAELLRQHCAQIAAQKADAEDVCARYCYGVRTRGDAVRYEIVKIEQSIDALAQQQKRLSERYSANQSLIRQTISDAEADFAAVQQKLAAMVAAGQSARETRCYHIGTLQAYIRDAENQLAAFESSLRGAEAAKQAILAREKLTQLAQRAFASSAAGKIALVAEYDQLVTVLSRVDALLQNKPIPRPFGYDPATVSLTPLKKRRKNAGRRKK